MVGQEHAVILARGPARSPSETPITAPSMDVLIVEPLEPEVVQWLETRYRVRHAPQLARDPLALRKALSQVRAMITPPSVSIDEAVLRAAPQLRAVGRLSAGVENIDVEACARAGVEVVRPSGAGAAAEAEFAIARAAAAAAPRAGAQRRRPAGRPRAGQRTVGLVGMTPAARPLAQLLAAFGAEVVGYDPALHANDALWSTWGVRPAAAARSDRALRRRVCAAGLLHALPRPDRRALPGRLPARTR